MKRHFRSMAPSSQPQSVGPQSAFQLEYSLPSAGNCICNVSYIVTALPAPYDIFRGSEKALLFLCYGCGRFVGPAVGPFEF